MPRQSRHFGVPYHNEVHVGRLTWKEVVVFFLVLESTLVHG
jgi:hypothetical protein